MAQDRTPHQVREILASGKDVTGHTERALIIDLTNSLWEFRQEYDRDKGTIAGDLGKLGNRVTKLELGPMRPPADSVSDLMESAGVVLSQRARDPRDKMDSDRAKAIAREVYEAAKNAEDAQALRSWRTRRWGIVLKVVEVVVAAAIGAVAAHYGLR